MALKQYLTTGFTLVSIQRKRSGQLTDWHPRKRNLPNQRRYEAYEIQPIFICELGYSLNFLLMYVIWAFVLTFQNENEVPHQQET